MEEQKKREGNGALEKASSIPITLQEKHLEVDEIRKYIAPQATHQELWLFAGLCRSLGLNPLIGEAHLVRFSKDSPHQAVISYQIPLKRAEASRKLKGWHVDWGQDEIGGEYAECTIYREDFDQPFVWKTYRKEVDAKQASWIKRPIFMTMKCCIKMAFQLCFPNENAGLPLSEEEALSVAPNARFYRAAVSDFGDTSLDSVDYGALRRQYYDLAKGKFPTEKDRHDFTESVVGKRSISQLTEDEYQKLFDALERLEVEPEPVEEAPPEGESDPIDGDVEFPSEDELANGAGKGEVAEEAEPGPKAKGEGSGS